jgi:hypothetical protein
MKEESKARATCLRPSFVFLLPPSSFILSTGRLVARHGTRTKGYPHLS